MTIITFEYVKADTILLKEDGRVVEEEILDCPAYEIYDAVKERGNVLIPKAYYKLMRDQPVMSDTPFDSCAFIWKIRIPFVVVTVLHQAVPQLQT